ncbi:carbohydrate ABC transporter permease [Phytoactinopolyspora limicola]|uniref:carbohydrate ABC transporter permease n=1 Tax=Phytoactinopolyspora limicola TaxID=2715536 RepID=UPI00140B28A5|nr:carbohydrate ABC transporter permease [Phytoactinopolyspora limicola]
MTRAAGLVVRPGSIAKYTVLGVLSVLWLIPTYLLIINAAKPLDEYSTANAWVPSLRIGLFDNIADAWGRVDLASGAASTLLYATVAPALAILVGAAAGFAIIALRLKYGFVWFMVIFAGTIVPLQMLLAPLFLGYAWTGMFDTRAGMILIHLALNVPFATFVMRNFFTGVAYEMFEAATMDGAHALTIFFRIYLPLAKAALGAIFILQFVGVWNDLLMGLTLTQSSGVRPAMTALVGLQGMYSGAAPTAVLAGGLIMSLPTIVLFLVAQRLFRQGLSLGQLRDTT